MELLRRLIREDEGVTAIEYTFIAFFIAVAIIGAVTVLGATVSGFFGSTAAAFP
ncbi:MAG: Flp family type IVb pilin [Chloroflexi bacterium]|nr:Flp family type IVb pilin [Chloroflexota bacterium]